MQAALILAAMAGLPAIVIFIGLFLAGRRRTGIDRKVSPLRYAARRGNRPAQPQPRSGAAVGGPAQPRLHARS